MTSLHCLSCYGTGAVFKSEQVVCYACTLGPRSGLEGARICGGIVDCGGKGGYTTQKLVPCPHCDKGSRTGQ